jgi:hypothetical protein
MSPSAHLRSKPRSYMQPLVDLILPRQSFLIVCQGMKTEPLYFEGFRTKKQIIVIESYSRDPRRLVEKALELQQKAEQNEEPFDQVWCVFDRDEFPRENFTGALKNANDVGVQVAYSNEAFELWYLLHFEYFHTAITRQQYIDKLDTLLGIPYKKNNPGMFDLLFNRQPRALANAARLLGSYQPVRPYDDNPSTTVHLLVEQLLRNSR